MIPSITDALAPRRRRGVELLDDPASNERLAVATLKDVAMANAYFGGTSAILASLEPAWKGARWGNELSLLDIGTGVGDIPYRAREHAADHGVRLRVTGLERTHAVAAEAQKRVGEVKVGDARELPFPDKSFDLVSCSQVLHHFEDDEAATVLREMDRVAKRLAVVADLRRSWPAAIGIWAVSFVLGFHPVSRHDGTLSVLRGYRRRELGLLVERAVGIRPKTRDRVGFRVTAAWSPAERK